MGDHWERVGIINYLPGEVEIWPEKDIRHILCTKEQMEGWPPGGRVYVNSRGEVLDDVNVANTRAPWVWSTNHKKIILE